MPASYLKTMIMKKNLNFYLLKAYTASARVTHDKVFFTLSLFSLLFVIISTAASAQTAKSTDKSTKLITGIVRDDEQQVLVGVSVSVKGTTQGVLTDENGRFSISVDLSKHDLLVFSYITKKTTELSLAEKGNRIALTLYNDPSVFTELVVTGEATADQVYTEKKSDRNNRKKSKRLF